MNKQQISLIASKIADALKKEEVIESEEIHINLFNIDFYFNIDASYSFQYEEETNFPYIENCQICICDFTAFNSEGEEITVNLPISKIEELVEKRIIR